MGAVIREYVKSDVPELNRIWNGIVSDGTAFPQTELLDEISGEEFFSSQSRTAAAFDEESGEMLGLYTRAFHDAFEGQPRNGDAYARDGADAQGDGTQGELCVILQTE